MSITILTECEISIFLQRIASKIIFHFLGYWNCIFTRKNLSELRGGIIIIFEDEEYQKATVISDRKINSLVLNKGLIENNFSQFLELILRRFSYQEY